jgi:hypothetical protein
MFRNGDITTKMDAVTKVARDCLLACVECNILQVTIVSCAEQFCGSKSVRIRDFFSRSDPDPAL